ncbi:LOW QUALITY PROTEIN: proteolipid protein 2 [Melanerpes formicivorus]|uniref:LOW QUALITY PROTEIN: proteolipid protein 2 n=1 Tax=Melanerpes formicivorus TaxID=211600 RepID=UPI00358F5A56
MVVVCVPPIPLKRTNHGAAPTTRATPQPRRGPLPRGPLHAGASPTLSFSRPLAPLANHEAAPTTRPRPAAPGPLPRGPPLPDSPRGPPLTPPQTAAPFPVTAARPWNPAASQSGPRACLGFSRTHKGLVLIGEIALCVLALVCYGASRTPGYASLAVCELVFAALMLAVWGVRAPPRLPIIHWGDFIRCLVGSLLFLITSLIVIIGHRDGAGTAAGGCFGLLAGLLLAYDGYLTLPRRGGHSAAESPDGA